jgi:hypothetical protein
MATSDKRKFKMTLVQGGGNSFVGALRNTGNKIDVGIDEVLFKVGDEDSVKGTEDGISQD